MATLFNGDVQGTDNMARFICDTCNHEWTATSVLPCELCNLRLTVPDLTRQLADSESERKHFEQCTVDALAERDDALSQLAEARDEIERWNPCEHTGFESEPCAICGYPDPGATIAFLNQEIARLSGWKKRCIEEGEEVARLFNDKKLLKAEIARLRKALEKIDVLCSDRQRIVMIGIQAFGIVSQITKAALEASDK